MFVYDTLIPVYLLADVNEGCPYVKDFWPACSTFPDLDCVAPPAPTAGIQCTSYDLFDTVYHSYH